MLQQLARGNITCDLLKVSQQLHHVDQVNFPKWLPYTIHIVRFDKHQLYTHTLAAELFELLSTQVGGLECKLSLP